MRRLSLINVTVGPVFRASLCSAKYIVVKILIERTVHCPNQKAPLPIWVIYPKVGNQCHRGWRLRRVRCPSEIWAGSPRWGWGSMFAVPRPSDSFAKLYLYAGIGLNNPFIQVT